jgi:uncharacterized membrane protein
MSKEWAENLFLAKDLNDQQMEAIPNPRLELHIHVLYKTVEAGIILGGGIIGPIFALVRKRPLVGTVFRSARNGAIIGAIAGPLMLEGRLRDQTPESVYDRCYRLRRNRNQVRVDRGVTYGAAVGAATTAFMGQGVLPGLLLGIGLSCLAGGAYNSSLQKKPAPAQVEK